MTLGEPMSYLLLSSSFESQENINDIQKYFENGTEMEKIAGLRRLIVLMSNGDPCDEFLMPIIRFVLPLSKNKTIKKLLLLFFELCSKTDSDGKLRQEMILVCNAVRNDLQHPNEYVRAMTLRFVAKLEEIELLEPLIPSVRSNLEHRYTFVRKQAFVTVAAIFQKFSFLIPDAPQFLLEALTKENDTSSKRIALICLSKVDLGSSMEFLKGILHDLDALSEPMLNAVFESMKLYCNTIRHSYEKGLVIETCLSILSTPSCSDSLRFDIISFLTEIGDSEEILKTIMNGFIHLAVKISENNVRFAILSRIEILLKQHTKDLESLVPDLLNAFLRADATIRQRAVALVPPYLSSNNSSAVTEILSKELNRLTVENFTEKNEKDSSRQVLLKCLRESSVITLGLATRSVDIMLSNLCEPFFIANEAALYLKGCCKLYPSLRPRILSSILEMLPRIRVSRIARACIFLIGDYASHSEELTFPAINSLIDYLKAASSPNADSMQTSADLLVPSSRILADGSYVTDTAAFSKTSSDKRPASLKSLMSEHGNCLIPSAVSVALMKLLFSLDGLPEVQMRQLRARCALALVEIVKAIGSTGDKVGKLNPDSVGRLTLAIRVLTENIGIPFQQALLANFDGRSCDAPVSTSVLDEEILSVPPVSLLPRAQINVPSLENNLERICGDISGSISSASKLEQAYQLSGFGDKIFAETYISLDNLFLDLDVIIVNQTEEPMNNVYLELIPAGSSSRIVVRPLSSSLAAFGFLNLKAHVKLESAQQGNVQAIFYFENSVTFVQSAVYLRQIDLDVSEFLLPYECSDHDFSSLWKGLEWEHKIDVKFVDSNIRSFDDALNSLAYGTGMSTLSRVESAAYSGVASCNLIALSKFGEKILANISLEQIDGQISGHIRLRSKSNSLVFLLGNKISSIFGA